MSWTVDHPALILSCHERFRYIGYFQNSTTTMWIRVHRIFTTWSRSFILDYQKSMISEEREVNKDLRADYRFNFRLLNCRIYFRNPNQFFWSLNTNKPTFSISISSKLPIYKTPFSERIFPSNKLHNILLTLSHPQTITRVLSKSCSH